MSIVKLPPLEMQKFEALGIMGYHRGSWIILSKQRIPTGIILVAGDFN
jgi:hypothetical protein